MDRRTFRLSMTVVAVALAVGAFDWPYGYYQLLRLVVTAGGMYLTLNSIAAEKSYWAVAAAIVTLLFNPIFPIHLDKETWRILDLACAVLFGCAAWFFAPRTIRNFE